MQANVEPTLRPGAWQDQLQSIPILLATFDRALASLFKNTQPNELREEWQLISSTFQQAIFQQRPKFDLLRNEGTQGMCDMCNN